VANNQYLSEEDRSVHVMVSYLSHSVCTNYSYMTWYVGNVGYLIVAHDKAFYNLQKTREYLILQNESLTRSTLTHGQRS